MYRLVQSTGVFADDLCPCFVRLAPLNAGKIMVSLRALRELGLIEKIEKAGQFRYIAAPNAEKKNLADAPILQSLAL